MAFTKRTIKDRLLQYPKRYRLNLVAGETNVYDLEQITGTIAEAGTPINSGYLQPLEDAVASIPVFQNAGGTGTAITLDTNLIDGYSCTFIVKANNSGASTTINGKPLYKPATTTAPVLTANKAVTVWYSATGDCFFIKASAEGNAVAGNVLADKTFSNDNDTGLTGTMPNNAGFNSVGANVDGVTTVGRIYMKPSMGYYDGIDDLVYADDPDFIAGNFLATKNIFGLQGSIPIRTGDTASTGITRAGTTVKLLASVGYRNGTSDYVTHSDANDVASNIRENVTIRGLTGTLRPNAPFFPVQASRLLTPSIDSIGSYLAMMTKYESDGYSRLYSKTLSGNWMSGVATARYTCTLNYYGNGIVSNGSILVALAMGSASGLEIMSSSDGITWTKRFSTSDNVAVYTNLKYVNGYFVALYNNTTLLYSSNGINWFTTTSPSNARGIEYFNGKYYISVPSLGRVYYSTSLTSWTTYYTVTFSSTSYGYILASTPSGLAIGDNTNIIFTSDGINFTSKTRTAPETFDRDCLFSIGNKFYVRIRDQFAQINTNSNYIDVVYSTTDFVNFYPEFMSEPSVFLNAGKVVNGISTVCSHTFYASRGNALIANGGLSYV